MPCKTKEEQLTRQRAWYARNKEKEVARAIERNRERRQSNRVWLDEIKSNTPCMDCGISYPPCVMDYDHINGNKKFNVSQGLRDYSRDTLLEEIAKCELVCANCHRIRTRDRGYTNK